MEPAAKRSKVEYRIVCVVRRADGNVRGVCYSERGQRRHVRRHLDARAKPGTPFEQGHRLYAVSPSTGVEVEVELHGEGIRIKPGESVDFDLDDLPDLRRARPDTLSRLGEVSERSKERDWKSRTC